MWVQWGMLCFSSPTSLNRRFVENGVILKKYKEAINLALQSAFMLPFWRMNTPRSCFLRSVHAVLCRSPGRDRDANREMRSWGLGEWSVLLLFDGGSDDRLNADK